MYGPSGKTTHIMMLSPLGFMLNLYEALYYERVHIRTHTDLLGIIQELSVFC